MKESHPNTSPNSRQKMSPMGVTVPKISTPCTHACTHTVNLVKKPPQKRDIINLTQELQQNRY